MGTLFLSLEVVFLSAFNTLSYGDEIHFVFMMCYFFLFLLQVLVGLGGTIESNQIIYVACMIIYGSLMVRH